MSLCRVRYAEYCTFITQAFQYLATARADRFRVRVLQLVDDACQCLVAGDAAGIKQGNKACADGVQNNKSNLVYDVLYSTNRLYWYSFSSIM